MDTRRSRTWTSRPALRRRAWWTVPAGALAAVILALGAANAPTTPDDGSPEGAADLRPSEERSTPTGSGEVSVFEVDEVTAWLCPVRGRVTFRGDFGYIQADGTRHRGIDLYAPAGTPVVASVPGVVEHFEGTVPGLAYRLDGDDGRTYIGTHLSAHGEEGRVGFGDVIGYVGDTGNAVGSDAHLHFEIRENGVPIDPYEELDDACR